MKNTLFATLLIIASSLPVSMQSQTEIQTWSTDKEKITGFFDFYKDRQEDKLWLEIKDFNQEFLYVNSLTNGIGSNDIGLDRNQLGKTRLVFFQRQGSKVFLVQPNLKYRAITENQAEKQAVKEAFAESIIFGFTIVAEENEHVIIDLTPFLMRDTHGIAKRLRDRNQGNYSLDKTRSALFFPGTKGFPKNTEFEATLTFIGQATGAWIKSVVPSPESITIHQHHSFIELPDDNYQMREYDPGCGLYPITFKDYAQPISSPIDRRYVQRHRLKKKNPGAKLSEAVEPIIYYLDAGTPEPIRSALLEGASWWNQAFEAAGYQNAFQVKILPEDADPMDIRYNVINWTHRSTRGWSYGSSVVDPRTGEIIKGHVLLGSLRVRQDFLIAQGLIKAYPDGTTPDPRLEKMALARLKQLAAHEVGHTLGMQHNFAASTNKNSSVMDYPHPYIQLTKEGVDFSKAYGVGIGEWDKRTVLYGYQDFNTPKAEKEGLKTILTDNIKMKFRYIQDRDARPQGSAHAYAHLWDNGNDAIRELERIIQLRKYAIDNFSEFNIPKGAPMSSLQDVFVPVYLMHRYQVEAAVKLIGGYKYTYANRGDGQKPIQQIDEITQKQAEIAILQTLTPAFLFIPKRITTLMPPLPPGYNHSPELFEGNTNPIFDPLAAAESNVSYTLDLLLNPNRLERVRQQSIIAPNYFSVETLLKSIHTACRYKAQQSPQEKLYAEVAEKQFIVHLLTLLADPKTTLGVRGQIQRFINIQEEKYLNKQGSLNANPAHFIALTELIRQFREDPAAFKPKKANKLPAGSPIGCGFLEKSHSIE